VKGVLKYSDAPAWHWFNCL